MQITISISEKGKVTTDIQRDKATFPTGETKVASEKGEGQVINNAGAAPIAALDERERTRHSTVETDLSTNFNEIDGGKAPMTEDEN